MNRQTVATATAETDSVLNMLSFNPLFRYLFLTLSLFVYYSFIHDAAPGLLRNHIDIGTRDTRFVYIV